MDFYILFTGPLGKAALLFLVFIGGAFLVNYFLGRVLKKREEKEQQSKAIYYLIQVFQKLILYGAILAALLVSLNLFYQPILEPVYLTSAGLLLFKALAIILGARLALQAVPALVEHIFLRRRKTESDFRTQTLQTMLRSALNYLIFFIAGIMLLENFGVDTSSILVSAGIIGLAVGFGAQNLVRDIISGFFIILENQFDVGERIQIGGVMGIAEEIGMRTIKLREWTGQLHIFPNGQIDSIINYSRGSMVALAEVSIAYEEDVEEALQVLREEGQAMYAEMEVILEEPLVLGVVKLDDSGVNIRAMAYTQADYQWAVGREMLKRFKQALNRAGIEIPYPRRVIINQPAQSENSEKG